ncbi:hypothetical protein WH47_08755 [Habropoda laboriosa]|uniref:Uncharacterized protein n=1 Tax=Habropoda laboriosa TaxID=597456 RepID=A0A0L7R697_9HYME|nr:PREDICTED: uncharacterized protein LOC108571335 [Habropoda laboriosa]KOC66363.1 hypothetical protein WH47_08755 [Habropoda laboriosa]
MTPLPWWVLLALLLVVVASYPVDHACARLCRVRNTSPEITGGCEHQQKLVLQFSGGRFPIQRLFRLCLTPCQGSSTSNSLSFDVSQACRSFRDSLIERHGCICDDLHDVRARNLEEEDRKVEGFEAGQLNEADEWNLPKKFAKHRPASSFDDLYQLMLTKKQAYKDTMEITKLEENILDSADTEDAILGKMEGSNEESSIDWDLWCMAQCDNGKGGSACNCDIIP